MKKEYLEHLLLLTKNLLIDNEFSGKLEYKVNRPMNAVFKVEMTQAFDAKKSTEEKKQAAIQYIQQELDKFPPPSTEKIWALEDHIAILNQNAHIRKNSA